MDNLFEVLIYAIIIISFLSSFFKKKEQPKQAPSQQSRKPDSISYQQESTKFEPEKISQRNEDYDIMRELENLFKGDIKIPEQQPQPSSETSSNIPDRNLDRTTGKRTVRKIEDRNYIENKATERRSSIDQRKKEKVNVDSKIEPRAKDFEKVLAGPRKQKASQTEFNRKLKNPVNIKEYILFSEILGKPKALRR
jgi:hypothetical protein